MNADGSATATSSLQTVAGGHPDPTTTTSGTPSSRQRRRIVVIATLRTLATVAIIVTLYYLVPMDHPMDAATVVELILVALALCAIVAWQIRAIGRSEHPNARAAEALASSIPLYLLLFAATYFLMARSRHATFGAPLSRTDAMYFSSTVFTTVGFGDITAKTEAARILVTVQMMLDLVIVGLVVRLIVNAIKVSQRRHAPGDPQ